MVCVSGVVVSFRVILGDTFHHLQPSLLQVQLSCD